MATETMELVDEAAGELIAADSYTKYLTFCSDNLLFGVNASYVVEIITHHAMTRVPMTPHYIKGIINLRGQIIPIIDIRLRLGKMEQEDDSIGCVIVLDIEGTQIGILVDQVAEMVDIDESMISSGLASRQPLVSGMISLAREYTMLVLDCAQLVSETA